MISFACSISCDTALGLKLFFNIWYKKCFSNHATLYRAVHCPLTASYNASSENPCFSDAHRWNSRYNPNPEMCLTAFCGSSHTLFFAYNQSVYIGSPFSAHSDRLAAIRMSMWMAPICNGAGNFCVNCVFTRH